MWKTKFGQRIYVSPSGYEVYQNPGYRWLTLGSSALQTVINRRHPKRPMLYYLPALTLMARQFPEQSCMLGLGGAAVAHMLSASPYSLTAVELSAEIIAIAQNYFYLNTIPNLNLIQHNALNYLQECSRHYTHLIVDLYGADSFPSDCNSDVFFQMCKERLVEGGFLAVNLANTKEQWPIVQRIKNHFKHTVVFPIKKCANLVVIASNTLQSGDFLAQVSTNKEVNCIVYDDLWGHIGELRLACLFKA